MLTTRDDPSRDQFGPETDHQTWQWVWSRHRTDPLLTMYFTCWFISHNVPCIDEQDMTVCASDRQSTSETSAAACQSPEPYADWSPPANPLSLLADSHLLPCIGEQCKNSTGIGRNQIVMLMPCLFGSSTKPGFSTGLGIIPLTSAATSHLATEFCSNN